MEIRDVETEAALVRVQREDRLEALKGEETIMGVALAVLSLAEDALAQS